MAVPKTAALPLGDAPPNFRSVRKFKQRAILATSVNYLQERIDFFRRHQNWLILFFTPQGIERLMRIVQVTTEFAPLAKAGGLGEVAVGLSRQLTFLGNQVEIILPKIRFYLSEAFNASQTRSRIYRSGVGAYHCKYDVVGPG